MKYAALEKEKATLSPFKTIQGHSQIFQGLPQAEIKQMPKPSLFPSAARHCIGHNSVPGLHFQRCG